MNQVHRTQQISSAILKIFRENGGFPGHEYFQEAVDMLQDDFPGVSKIEILEALISIIHKNQH